MLSFAILVGGSLTALTSYAASISAANVSYSNSTSGLSATNAQSAIDEVYGKYPSYVSISSLPNGTVFRLGNINCTKLSSNVVCKVNMKMSGSYCYMETYEAAYVERARIESVCQSFGLYASTNACTLGKNYYSGSYCYTNYNSDYPYYNKTEGTEKFPWFDNSVCWRVVGDNKSILCLGDVGGNVLKVGETYYKT